MLWSPPADALETTALGRFAAAHGFERYDELLAWSLADLDGFWRAVTDATGVRWRRGPQSDVALADARMPGARWFPGAELNYAEHALAPLEARSDAPVIVARSQTRPDVTLSWAELYDQVVRCAAGLRRLGVGRGDCVAAYLPNIPETIVAFLATASIGAIWSSCAPEFGVRAVVDRLAQIEPTVLLAVDGYRYGDKVIDRRDDVRRITDALPTLRHVIGLRYLGVGDDGWSSLHDQTSPLIFEALPFDHPLYVLYSSGTTGLPKAIVHGHGGITVEHLKVLTLHQDLRPGDRFCWFTTTGWMMWNYLVSGLLVGATLVLLDGDPGFPDLGPLWNLAADTDCAVLGTSAPFLMASRKARLRPRRGPSLRWVGSTGAPLPAVGFEWVAEELGVPVASISGGTDVCSAFVGNAPLVAVRAGEIGCRLLGCAVEAFDDAGRPCAPGTTGELVVTAPMPSMPVGFWGDVDGSQLREAYFGTFPGVWRHGDWITFADDGACTITGRSDATLNREGVRLGTSDFYAVIESFPEIVDSLVVHLDDDGDELLLFVLLLPDHQLDDDLRARLRRALRSQLSPRHVPDSIQQTPAIPRTLSGKRCEIPVKRILSGLPPERVAARDSLVDPSALDHFAELAHHRATS